MANKYIPDEETLERMVVAITVGDVPKAKNADERELRAALTRQINEIEAKGGTVAVPNTWA